MFQKRHIDGAPVYIIHIETETVCTEGNITARHGFVKNQLYLLDIIRPESVYLFHRRSEKNRRDCSCSENQTPVFARDKKR